MLVPIKTIQYDNNSLCRAQVCRGPLLQLSLVKMGNYLYVLAQFHKPKSRENEQKQNAIYNEWLEHVLRMDNTKHSKIAISWTPDGKRKRCRPKETWRRTIERERKDLGFQTWTDATKVATEINKWRGLVKGLILLKKRRK